MSQEEQDRLDRMEKKLDAIITAMEGNNLGTTGIVRRLDAAEKWIDQARVRLAVIAAMAGGSVSTAIEAAKAWFVSGGHER